MSRCLRIVWPVAAIVIGCVDLGEEPWEFELPPQMHAPAPTGGDGADAVDPLAGSGGADDGSRDVGGSEDESGCPHPDGQPQEAIVRIVSNTFRPKVISICAGDTVTWQNLDTKEHTIFTGTPEAPDGYIATSKFYSGESFSFVFDDVATYLYYCSTHKKKMRDAQVIVQ